jgi:hypothetical protein
MRWFIVAVVAFTLLSLSSAADAQRGRHHGRNRAVASLRDGELSVEPGAAAQPISPVAAAQPLDTRGAAQPLDTRGAALPMDMPVKLPEPKMTDAKQVGQRSAVAQKAIQQVGQYEKGCK